MQLIANRVKINMYFVFVKTFIVLTTFVPLFTFNWYYNNYNNNCLFDTTIRSSAYSLFVSNYLYSLDQYNKELQASTSHKVDWITTDCCPLASPFI